jgi:hypothetical protein
MFLESSQEKKIPKKRKFPRKESSQEKKVPKKFSLLTCKAPPE